MLFIDVYESIRVSDTVSNGYAVGLLLVLTRQVFTVEVGVKINVFDQLSVTEDLTVFIPILYSSTYDAVTVTEDVNRSVTSYFFVFEELSAFDDDEPNQTDVVLTSFIPTSDTVSISEDVKITKVSIVSVFDTITTTEEFTLFNPADESLSDQVTVTDVLNILIPEYKPLIIENISIEEDIQTLIINSLSVNDDVSVSEDLAITSFSDESLSDSITVSEDVAITLISTIRIYDAILSYEYIESTGIVQTSVFDTVSISENFQSHVFSELSTYDTVSTDDVLLLDGITILLSSVDTVSVVDIITPVEETDTTLYEAIQIDEMILITLVSLPSVYDEIVASEEVSTAVETYSYNIPTYRPRGYKMIMDNFQYGGGVRIGGY